MATGIVGIKKGMTQVFNEDGVRLPLTIVEAGPCVVLQVKTEATDGYNAVCVGFREQDIRKFNKPRAGLFRKALGEKTKIGYRVLQEFRVDDPAAFTVGQEITVTQFVKDELIDVIGTSKGRGFAGTIRRHHFARGPMTHGSKNTREPGSIGMHTYPAHVLKGKRMAGQWGNKRITTQRLRVYGVDADNHLLFIIGAVPGATRGLVTIMPSVKA